MNLFPRHIYASGIIPQLRLWLLPILGVICLVLYHLPAFAQTSYAIRVASYQERAEAAKKIEELKKLGHHQAFVKTVNLKEKGTWHRVYVEQFNTRSEAVKEAKVFQKLELIAEYGIDQIHDEEEKPAPQATKTQKVFFLHVHSFQEKENAEKKVAILKKEGQKAFYVQEQSKGQDWYRVYVGEFESESAASQTGSELISKGLITYFKTIEIDRGELGGQ